MYAEELKQKPVSPLAGAIITLGCVFAVLLTALFVSVLQLWLNIYWPQFVMYAAVVVGIIWAIPRFFTEYIYLIERDRITFGRRVGKREKELLSVPLRDVISIRPYDAEVFRRMTAEKKKFKFTFRKKDTWSVIECTSCLILVTCTPEYTEHLKACLKSRT